MAPLLQPPPTPLCDWRRTLRPTQQRPWTSHLERIQSALEAVGLDGRESETISRLSGGEKQRVGLARAIAKEATCVFADEPTASLDEKNRSMVIRLLEERARAGATVVLATHDEQAMDACDTLVRLVPPQSH
ncbi:ATP-binding cassette domain-containing protein [Glutamicibacter creatinolyticus]|uniref:ATP-binding cassette domain-containing protein n=1 Tax=Glutamicibacter creatinolyticus TaxID=162496 RepID=UPI001110A05D|nr:ATP-binding cassette domain-containing protein [Glutamicibacter creatinolyticus]